MTTSRPTQTPAIPPAKADTNALADAVRALKETVEVREGRLGDPLDKAVTFRELEAAGLLKFNGLKGGQGAASPGGAFNNPSNPGFGVDAGRPDLGGGNLTQPPGALNVRARGIGGRSIMVTWDIPAYPNHSYTEVYRIPVVGITVTPPITLDDLYAAGPDFVRARPWGADNRTPAYVGRADGGSFIDTPPAELDGGGSSNAVDAELNPAPFYYWVRFVSEAKVPGPFHQDPAVGSRTLDPSAILTALTGEVRETDAYQYLQQWLALGAAQNDPITLAGGLAAYLRDNAAATNSLAQRVDVTESEVEEGYARMGDSTFWMAGVLTNGAGAARGARITRFAPIFSGSSVVGAELTVDAMPSGLVANSSFTTYANADSGLGMFGNKRFSAISVTGNIIRIGYQSWMPQSIVNVPAGGTASARLVLQQSSTSPNEVFENLAIVAQEVLTEVTPNRAIGRHVQTVRVQIENSLNGRIDAQNQVINQINADLNGVRNIYSVNLRQEQNGIVSAAGFALSLESNDPNRPARSAFIVSADQFAIMGSGSGATRVRTMNRISPKTTRLTVFSSAGFTAGRRVQIVVGSDANVEVSAYRGIQLEVVSAFSSTVDVRAQDGRDLPMAFIAEAEALRLNIVLAPEQSMPFIVDTNRNVVAIRGSLVVDGLVTANDADIRGLLTAKEIWAQSIVGQFATFDTLIGRSIIAGAPTRQDRAGTTDPSTGVGQWRMGMFNPVAAPRGADGLRRVMTFHQPYFNNGQFSLVHPDGRTREGFYLDEQGNVFIGGNCTVRTDGSAFAGFGVSGLNAFNQPQRFALYVGNKSLPVSEANGVLWVGESLDANGNPRVGINADLFLGDEAFSLPSGDGYVTVKQGRSGLNGAVFATATVSTIPTSEDLSRRAVIGVDMYLIPSSAAGLPSSNASSVSSSRFPIQSSMVTRLNRHIAVFSSEGEYTTSRTSGTLAGAYHVSHYQIDGKNDSECFTIAGSVVVPPGEYRVLVALWPKPAHRQGTFGAYAGNFFAMQVARGAAVGTSRTGASTTPPQGSGVNLTPTGETTVGTATPLPTSGGEFSFFPPSEGGQFMIP